MRRLSKACTNESHPLYGAFMSSLSTAIFEWDPEDVALLKKAKEGELRNAGLSNPSSAAVTKAINKNEMARHCKRRTRGAADTVNLLDAIFSSASDLTDTLGTPLLRTDSSSIWQEQQRHVDCIQDPEGLQLYTRVRTLAKGGVSLPVYRCARGTVSLESFHAHLVNFIPGNFLSIKKMLFQIHTVG